MEKKDGYSTCVDYAIDTITKRYGLYKGGEWKEVKIALQLIQICLTFVPRHEDAVSEHLRNLVACIEDALKNVEVDIECEIKKGDAEGLEAVSCSLLEKIRNLNARITETYGFLFEEAFSQITKPLVLFTEPNLWGQFFNLLINSKQGIISSLLRKTLYEEFSEVTLAVKHFGDAYVEYTSKWGDARLSGFGTLLQGGAICLARVLFLVYVEEMNDEDAIFSLLELRRRIWLIFPEILDMYKQIQLKKEDAKQLVDVILPREKNSLLALGDGLHPLIDDLLDSYSTKQEEDVKLLRSGIEKVVCDDILGTDDNDQLLQKIVLFKEEVDLRMLICRFDSILTRSTVLDSINMGLSLVQTFLNQGVLSEKWAPILKRVAGEVASLQVGTGMSGRRCDALKFKLSTEIMMVRIQVFLMEKCSPGLMVALEDNIYTLSVGLQLLFRYFSLLPTENGGYEELIIACFEKLANEELPSYYLHRSNQDFIDQMSVFVSSLLQEVNRMNAEIQDTALQCRNSIVLTMPKTLQGLGFVDSFLVKLRGLMIHEADLIGNSVQHHIEAVVKELEFFKSFLLMKGVGEKRHQNPRLQEQLITASREADYIIDWILLVQWDWKHMFWLSVVINEMKELNSELANFVQIEANNDSGAVHVSEQQTISRQASRALEVGEAVISLEDQEEIIIDQLITIGASQKRSVITIFGMPGIGKTTLAMKVYDHPRVRTHFKKLAWCCISQVYRRREFLLDILSDIITKSSNDDVDKKSDDELMDMVYKGLKGYRYCIVMDDVWSNQMWEECGMAFPDDKNGSRVIITTRNQEVGLKAQPDSVPHTLRSLTKEESWKLLQQKVFHGDTCPLELLEVGLMIADGCKGLPLSIVAIAGILKTTEKKARWWERIERDLNSRILDNPETQCMYILELSYNHLPDDLKPCFLYFAAFGEDSEVPVKKLIRLWIAEGFVRDVRDQNALLEDVAETYVMNLIARSLLMAVKIGSDGRIKSCRVHDMLYKVCLRKVKEDNFLQYVNGYDELFPSADRQLDYGVDAEYLPTSVVYNQYRLSLCSKRKHFVMLKPSGPSVRTLLFNATSDTFPRFRYDDALFITENFKILSILDIESINIGPSFPKGVEFLYPLRYLGISGEIRSVPPTIEKLWNLETLVVKGLVGKVRLPDTLWSMSKLRHLHVTTQAIFSLLNGRHESSSELRNMVSLSCPALFHGDDSEGVMKLFPKLRKLRCTFSEPGQHSEESIRFPALEFLVELESLQIIYYGHMHQYCQLEGVKFPLNLKKLSLSDFSFTWGDFSVIGKLPNLNILKLVSIAFDSSTWEMMADDEFRKLEYLKLESLKISEWNVESDDPVPSLKQLVLRNCTRIKEVPVSFGGIATLEMIELKWCSPSAEISVMAILEQKLELGHEFKAIINGFVAGPKSSIDE